MPDAEPDPSELPPLLAAAARAFALYGVRRTTLDDVAKQAGVSRSTVYRALGSKAEIQAKLSAARAAQTFERIRRAVPAGTGVAEALAQIVVLTFDAAFGNETTMRLAEHEPESLLPAFREPADGSPSVYLRYGELLGALLRERCPDVERLRLAPEAAVELTLRMQLSFVFAPTTRLPEPFELMEMITRGLLHPDRP